MGRSPKEYAAGEQGLELDTEVDDGEGVTEETKQEDVEPAEITASEFKGFVYQIPEEEYQRRIKLDVSNQDYINPSYNR